MTECAIVAIPDEYSPVWKVSSEKVPHLTMLYLGELPADTDESAMALFVQHVASYLSPFGLSVDHRGKLGDHDADVLFFDKNPRGFFPKLQNVRTELLTNNQIFTAFRSVKQYPEWTPHLTLGYPETPAKAMDQDRDHLSYIFFDKIAIWFGDFEGPTFTLKHDYTQSEAQGEFAMSDTDPVDAILKHYGVPGMKWGRRKAQDSGDTGPAVGETRVIQVTPGTKLKTAGGKGIEAHADAVKAAAAKQQAKASTTDALSDKDLKALVNRMNMEQQYSELTSKAQAREMNGAQKFVMDLVLNTGKQQIQQTVQSEAQKFVKSKLSG